MGNFLGINECAGAARVSQLPEAALPLGERFSGRARQMKGRASARACATTDRPFESTDKPVFTQPRITKGSKTVSFQTV